MNPTPPPERQAANPDSSPPGCLGDGLDTAPRQNLHLVARVFEFAREGILITDCACRIVDANPAFTRITGYAREEVLGQTPHLLSSGRHGADFYDAMWNAIRQDGHWSGEIWNRRKDGEIYPERLSIAAIRDPEGGISHFIGVFNDISLEKRQEAQLQYLAQHDALTGLPNRVLLADRIRQAIAQTKRADRLLAVGYLDLDGFKPINDTYGHEVGDRLLVEMARRMTRVLRTSDTVARLGGDEFVVLLPGLGSLEECEDAFDRLLAAIVQPLVLNGQVATLSASIGVSLYPSDDDDPDALLRHADQAMYVAKQAGRNRCHFHDSESDRRARRHQESRQRVRQALERGELELHYQPQINMRTGQVTGVEALARWRHPERGLLGPAEFLPVIENSELDIRLGEWALEEALGQLAAWQAQGLDLKVGVNISANHIQQPDFSDTLRDLLAAHGDIPPRRLELEILETAALEDLSRVSEVIRVCQRVGAGFALDDFGTGYSSLTYLKHLPVQALKIDQSFVRDMLHDTDDLAIVEGVIALAEAFGRDIIAEGVESLEAGLLLLQLGCAMAQGCCIARPMPAAELPAWIAAWNTPHAWSEHNFRRWQSEDFALMLAEYTHQEWINGLVEHIERGDMPREPLPMGRESCRFGRWYHGSGQVRYGHLPEYAAIDPLHQRVHALGQALLERLRAGAPEAARQGLAELFAARDELLARLHVLQDLVLADKSGAPPGIT